MFWNRFLSSWIIFCKIFCFWDMVDFVFNIRSELGNPRIWFRNANLWYPRTTWLGGFNPKASGTWNPECTTKVKYKIDHNSKNKKRTKKNPWTQKSVSEHCALFGTVIFFLSIFINFKIGHISKPKIAKTEDWIFIRFRTLRNNLDKKMKMALFKGMGGSVCR